MSIAPLLLTLALVIFASGYSMAFFACLIALATCLGEKRWGGALLALLGWLLPPLAWLYCWRQRAILAYPARLIAIGCGLIILALALAAVSLLVFGVPPQAR